MIQEQQPEQIGTIVNGQVQVDPKAVYQAPVPEQENPQETKKDTPEETQHEIGQIEQEVLTMIDDMKSKVGEMFKKQDELHQTTMSETTGKMSADHSSMMEKTTTSMTTKHTKELAKRDKQIQSLKDGHAKKDKKLKDLQNKVKEALM